jgi:hypothetical protein
MASVLQKVDCTLFRGTYPPGVGIGFLPVTGQLGVCGGKKLCGQELGCVQAKAACSGSPGHGWGEGRLSEGKFRVVSHE